VTTQARTSKVTMTARLARLASLVGLPLLAAFCLAGTSGCGGFFYAINAGGASSKLETAQQLGAEKYAPYEYYVAKEHLWKAMELAATSNYGDAIDLVDEAEKAADKAILLSKQGHEGAGR
jgi:hypothetical protein